MGGELGNEIYIDLLVSSGLSPPSFILIENNNFYTNLVSKSWCLFLGFRGYLGEIGSGEKKEFFTYVFFSHKQWCVRVSASIFVAQLALVHELRLSEAFYVLWLAQLVLMICTGPNFHANSNEVSLGPAIRATLCYVVKEKQHRRQQQHQQRRQQYKQQSVTKAAATTAIWTYAVEREYIAYSSTAAAMSRTTERPEAYPTCLGGSTWSSSPLPLWFLGCKW